MPTEVSDRAVGML